MKLRDEELLKVHGGISSALISAVVSAFKAVFDFGAKIGSTLRRAKTKNYC